MIVRNSTKTCFFSLLLLLGTIPLLQAQKPGDVVITEISYNPPESGLDSTEYIELYNTTSSDINLHNWSFTSGVVYSFPNVVIPANGYFVSGADSNAINNRFGITTAHQWQSGGLSNGGEPIVLEDQNGVKVDSLRYDDVAPWPVSSASSPDGGGSTIVLCNPNSDNTDGSNWKVSTSSANTVVNAKNVYGSPGKNDPACISTSPQIAAKCSGLGDTLGVPVQAAWLSGTTTRNANAWHGTKGTASKFASPQSLQDASSWVDTLGNFYVFGGYANVGGTLSYFNTFWKWDGTNWTWIGGDSTANSSGVYGTMGTPSSNNIPGGRSQATTWIDRDNNFWLFGGYGYDKNGDRDRLNDLWKWDGTQWTWVSGSDVKDADPVYGTTGVANGANVPGATFQARASVLSNGDVYIYGGSGNYNSGTSTGSGPKEELWKWDGSNWTFVRGEKAALYGTYGQKGVTASTSHPGSRQGHFQWIDCNDNLWVFGGTGRDYGTGDGLLSDMWKFDGTNWTWIHGDTIQKTHPVAGNWTTKGVLDQSYNPGGRSYGVAFRDNDGSFWLWGGVNDNRRSSQARTQDMWRWSVSDTAWAWMGGSVSANQQRAATGTKGVPHINNWPGGKGNFAGAHDPKNGTLYMFGGYGYESSSFGWYGMLWGLSAGENPAPRIRIYGNNTRITNGQTTTSSNDSTDFGTVNTMSTDSIRFMVVNPGDQYLSFNQFPRLTITGTHAADFSFDENMIGGVQANDTDYFKIYFAPLDTGMREATISWATNISNPKNDTFSFNVKGFGRCPVVNPTTMDVYAATYPTLYNGDTASLAKQTTFDQVSAGNTGSRTFYIKNTGSTNNLILANASVTGLYSVFSISSSPGASVSPGDSTSLTIEFAPLVQGIYSAEVSFSSNTCPDSVFSFTINATAPCNNSGTQWTQVGSTVYEANGEGGYFGREVDISENGQRMVVGAPSSYVSSTGEQGYVQMYEYDNNSSIWIPLGRQVRSLSIDTTGTTSRSNRDGTSTAISGDGNRMAVGGRDHRDFRKTTPNYGYMTGGVIVYEYDANQDSMVQVGQRLYGTRDSRFGWDVELSKDGNTLIVGAQYGDSLFNNSGYVRIYDLNNNKWVLRGEAISGIGSSDEFGTSVAISADGNTVAAGADYNDDNASTSGHVRIFTWSGTAWVQKGSTLKGLYSGDRAGSAVSLSADGNIVAFGEKYHDLNNQIESGDPGKASIYEFKNGDWSQMGSSITGTFDGNKNDDEIGTSVALSGNGTRLVVGAPNRYGLGAAKIFDFKNGDWTQVGCELLGDENGDDFGYDVAISGDGSTILVGNEMSSGNDSAYVKIFYYDDAVKLSMQVDKNVTCKGLANGKATGKVTDGVAPFTYSWSNGDTTLTTDSLLAGTYTFRVIDAAQDTVMDSVIITEPDSFKVQIASISHLLCNNDSSGVLKAAAGFGSNGTGGLTESFDSLGKLPEGWSSYNNISSAATNAFWKVGAIGGSPNYGMQGTTDNTGNGGHYVWVDGSSPYPGKVSLETPMVANESSFNFWMKRNTTGQAITKYNDFTIDVYDGTTWHNSIFYHDTMTTSGDWEEFSVDISSYLNGDSVKVRLNVDKVALSFPFYDDITIDDVSFGGTSANYIWTLGGTTVGNEATLSNIPAGTYKVLATSNAGCTDSTTATVTEPAALVSTPAVDSISCYGLTDGAISIGLTGGTTPFNFTWSHTAINNDTVTALGVDTFSVLVTDNNGCTVRDTAILSQPDSLNAMASVDSNVTCNGLMNGKASLSVKGGRGTYTYAWNNATTLATLSSVPAGTYEVAVTDASGCVDSSEVTITEPAALLAGVLTGDTSVCSGTAPGKITQITAVSGGVGNYSYQWQSSSDSSNWNNITGATSIDYQPLAVAGNTWYRRLDSDSNNCGPDTTNAIKIGIYAQPNTGFTATVACEGQQTNFTDTTSLAFGAIKSYFWSFGDKGTSNQQNPINVYKNSGSYTVTLDVIADGGCNSTITKTVSVNAMPSVDFSATAACEGTATAFTNKSAIATGNMTYSWNLGDNNSSTTASPNHNYANAGYYSVQLIATSDSGCVDSISKTVQVKNVPKPNFSATAVCEGNFTNFTNLTVGGSTYSWDFADGTGGSKQANPKNKYKNSGNYTVVLTATSTDGCSDTAQRVVNVYSLPTASFTATEECLGIATDFTNNSLGASNYQWVFGNGTSSNKSAPSVIYGAAGTYSVELTATTANGCTDVTSTTVTVNALPDVSFTTADICISENLTTTNNTTGAASYAWNFGDGNASIATAPTHTYSAFGNYRVSLVATSGDGCIDSTATTVNAFAVPEVGFTATDVCFGTSTNFSNNSKIADGTMTYVWDLGDGSTTGNPSPAYGYAAAGAYAIKLVATSNNGCKDSTTGSVDVYAMPTVDFTTASVCYGDTLFTNNTSSVASYAWSFGDGNTSTNASPFNFYSTAGDYEVQLIATTTNNCIDSLSKNISIYSKPVASFDVKDVCDEEAVQFANGSYNAIITGNSWDFGDGNADNRVNPANTYSTDGSYTTTLIVTSNEGCQDTLSKTVTVHPNPVMAFTNTTECDYDSTDFTNGSTIGSGTISYGWDFGTGDVSAIESPTYQFASAGAYKVSLTGTSDQGCVRSTEAIVVVNPSPQAAMSFANNCEGITSELASTSGVSAGSIAGYEWDLGDGNTAASEKVSHLYALDGSYTVELVVTTDEACRDTTTSTIVVYNKPTASFSSPDICFGQVSDFSDASIDANDYLYDFGDKWGISTNAAPDYTYEAPGSYDATLYVTSANGCKDTTTNTIVIYSLPTAQFNINHHCLLEDFTPEDKSAGDISNWNWNYGDGNNAAGIDPIYTYAEDGSYNVKLEVTDDNGCIDSLTKTVSVWPLPIIGIRTDTLVSKGYTVPMMAIGGVEYKWSPIENLDKPLQANPTATVLEDVTYTVTIANEFGCTKDTFATLRVEEDYTLEPSNIMTPDGNGQNDNWIVEKAQYYNNVEVIVFDRWGRIVYQSNAYNNTWSGTSTTGEPLPDGAYYYVVKVPTEREEYKGSITIFR